MDGYSVLPFIWPSFSPNFQKGIYHHKYRQDAAETNKTDWLKVDARLHVECFNGMAESSVLS